MQRTYQSIRINAPVDKVWNAVKDFHDLSWAPNVITKCEAVGDKSGTEIGAKRILNDAFHEALIELDDATHTMRYSIDNGPSPVSPEDVKGYVGHLHLLPITKDDTTFAEWSSSWESDSEDAVEFCHTIYVAFLDEMANSLG
jgi:hypothetical protein